MLDFLAVSAGRSQSEFGWSDWAFDLTNSSEISDAFLLGQSVLVLFWLQQCTEGLEALLWSRYNLNETGLLDVDGERLLTQLRGLSPTSVGPSWDVLLAAESRKGLSITKMWQVWQAAVSLRYSPCPPAVFRFYSTSSTSEMWVIRVPSFPWIHMFLFKSRGAQSGFSCIWEILVPTKEVLEGDMIKIVVICFTGEHKGH